MHARRTAALALVLLTAACGHATSRRGLPDTLPGATPRPSETADAPADDGRVRLRVADDGCTVLRADAPGSPQPGLSWHVTDLSGNEVDLVSAVGDTSFRPGGFGAFLVQLVEDDDSDFTPVSNEVAVVCTG